MKIFFRYLLFQIPEWFVLALFLWLLVDRTAISPWSGKAFFAFWIIKDLVIFPWVHRAYARDAKTGTDQLIGVTGVTQEQLNPEGYVKIQGELWKARADPPNKTIDPETVVKVRRAAGMTLIVESQKHEEKRQGL